MVGTVGPITRSVADAAAMFEILTSASMHLEDCSVPPLPFTPIGEPTKKLRIAYFLSDGFFEPVAAVKRAVLEAAAALEQRGHEVKPLEMPLGGEAIVTTYLALIAADGNMYSFKRALQGQEELYTSYKKLEPLTFIPNILRPPLAALLRLCGEHRKAAALLSQRSGGLSVRQYWERVADKREMERAFAQALKDGGFDGVLLPPLGLPAPPHGMIADLLAAFSYSFLANLLHWPRCALCQ